MKNVASNYGKVKPSSDYVDGIRLLKPEEMPHEVARAVLSLFDQLVARGVSPEKAAYVCATTFYGAWHKPGKEEAITNG